MKRVYSWAWMDGESDQSNAICALETTLWNLGIPTGDGAEKVGDDDWSWGQIHGFVAECEYCGIMETWKMKDY